jgi:glycosyltransferase involved in cell wall biosynthesis
LHNTSHLDLKIESYLTAIPHFGQTTPSFWTPSIVTDRCGIADIIDNQVGLVVPYDKEQLSNAILRLLGDDKMRREFGERGKLLVRERFNWEKIAEQMENVYRGVQYG